MNRDLARLRLENIAFHTYEVADVEKLLEYLIIEVLVLARANIVAGDVNLNSALAVLELHEAGLAHHAAAHDAPCDGDIALLILLESGYDVLRIGIHRELGCGIRVNAHVAQLLKTLSAYNLLFA